MHTYRTAPTSSVDVDEVTYALRELEPTGGVPVVHLNHLTATADVEYATAGWVDWYNHRRLHGSLGWHTPVEYEQDYYAALIREPQPASGRG